MATVSSTVLPYLIERVPALLFATIPPTAARFVVLTSGVNCRPIGARCAFSWSRTTPGSTVAVPASGSTSRMRVRYFPTSMINARPTVCPARLVPPPRGRIGTPYFAASWTTAIRSSRSAGTATPYGSISYGLASVA